jgi:hypothetical protein
LHVERDEEEDAEHRERDEQDGEVRAGEGAAAEEAEVEHRNPLAQLEQDERHEHRYSHDEGTNDSSRGPAVRIRLDQPVGESEETDGRRQKSGHVEALIS